MPRERVECSQDQWDIYKLDPAYECHVHAPPALSIIHPATTKIEESKPVSGKRRMSETSFCPDMPRAKPFHPSLEDDEQASEDEYMVVDDTGPSARGKSVGARERAKKHREEVLRNRKERREKGARRVEKLARREDEVQFDFSGPVPRHSHSVPPPDSTGKRKGPSRLLVASESMLNSSLFQSHSCSNRYAPTMIPIATHSLSMTITFATPSIIHPLNTRSALGLFRHRLRSVNWKPNACSGKNAKQNNGPESFTNADKLWKNSS